MPDSIAFRLRRFANALAHPVGLHLTRRSRAFEMADLLEAARRRGFQPGTVVDIGASNGVWSRRTRRVFPQASFVLFEPLHEHRAALERLKTRYGFHVVPAAAGAAAGRIAFSVDPALDGSAAAPPGAAGDRQVSVEPVDAVLNRLALPGPYCLKLDTHGYELPILAGAKRTLQETSLLIIESYNFELTPGSLRFHQLCSRLEEDGFRCVDLADPMRRPRDGVLWQMDLAFAPLGSACFASTRYV